MRTPSQQGRASRSKGQRGERATVRELQAALGPGWTVRRGSQAREGRDEPDVVIEGLPVWVEVKSWASRPSWGQMAAALEQAQADSSKHVAPGSEGWGAQWGWQCVAVIREDRREPLAVVRHDSTTAVMPWSVVIARIVAVWGTR